LDDLGWEYDRMSSSGQITMDKIWKLVGLPTFSDVEEEVEKKLEAEEELVKKFLREVKKGR
jgi:DNA polymerase III gamma/tau subunit